MADFPGYRMAVWPVLTPAHLASYGFALSGNGTQILGAASSGTWTVANQAYYYPFSLYDWATAYQLLFWVGATSSGNIDVGIYDSQGNKIISAGSTAMSATVNTVQEINITDTLLAPGHYMLAGAVDNTTGTVFRLAQTDELAHGSYPIYTEATAFALPATATPIQGTDASSFIAMVGIQFRSVF